MIKNLRFSASALFLTLLAIVLLSAGSAQAQYQHHTEWSYNLSMYEVNVRQFTPEGTFEAFEEHLDRLEELGVGILWLMPVHPIGVENRLGSLGSYYSVKDFKGINPEFGDHEDFARMVNKAHDRGMFVIMDWVPNHTSWDNYLTVEHPEWYVTDSNGNFIPPPGTNWSDVIQLDHSVQELRDYMVEAMQFWVEEFGVDGFRFDAVNHVPDYFWEDVIPRLYDIRPDLLLLAESDGPELHDLGFDISHGWGMYGFGHGVLKRIADGENTSNHLNTYMNQEFNNYDEEDYRLYFTSNHDENSWYGTTEELFGDASEVFAVLISTINGMPLIYNGQEAGLDKRLAFFDKDEIEWQDHPKAELYRTLFELKRNNEALWNGSAGARMQRVTSSLNASIFAFLREKNEDRVLVAMNLTGSERTFNLNGTAYTGTWRDVFTDEVITLQESAQFTLPAWGYVVYEGDETGTSYVPENELPDGLKLDQNYPNPFNPTTVISFYLPEAADVQLSVYDTLGRKTQTLKQQRLGQGTHSVSFDGSGLTSGIYFYELRAGNERRVRSMMLVK